MGTNVTTVTTYTNDTLPDIAYLLVFNNFSLQERLRLRVICQRWKTIIEADCAQMSTLRVFGNRTFLDKYLRRTEYHSIVPPTPGNTLKYDPSPMNTIILKRPASDRVDIHFLARLFPTISNLALAWAFGESLQEFVKVPEKGERAKFKVSSVLEPDIFALLSTWAPTLHSLYLVTRSYRCDEPQFKAGRWKQSFHKEKLDASQITAFWRCLSLMAPTLQKLDLDGVNLRDAPECFTMPVLKEMLNSYTTFGPDSLWHISPEKLNRMAPALQSFGLPFLSVNICSLVMPATVKRIIICLMSESSLDNVAPCPSITHLKVQLFESNPNRDHADFFTKLMAKFPSTTSLTIFDGNMLHGWLLSKGKKLGTHQSAGLFGRIEKLTLKIVTSDYLCFMLWVKEDDWYTLLFRGISTQFTGLKKLTLAIEPDSEAVHCKLSETLTHLKGQCIPRVELAFTLDMSVEERKLPFTVQSLGAEASAIDLSFCCLTPGCVFAPISLPN